MAGGSPDWNESPEDLEIAVTEILNDFCDRNDQGEGASIEDLVGRIEEPLRSPALAALIELELELRVGRGERPELSEYRLRFADDTAVVDDTFPGRFGDYAVDRIEGEGAFGRVYKAAHIKSGSVVAIKLLRDGRTEPILPDLHQQNPAVAAAFDHGKHGGHQYLVMPYVEGKSLREYLDRFVGTGEYPPESDVLRIGIGLVKALRDLHRLVGRHLDVKPENILIDRDDKVHLIDFGFVQKREERHSPEARYRTVGTWDYMAPELQAICAVEKDRARQQPQDGTLCDTETRLPPYTWEQIQAAVGTSIGVEADIWSVGVILYELLTLDLPFARNDEDARLRGVLHGRYEIPEVRRPQLDPRWQVIERCLQSDPGNRIHSARRLLEELERPAVSEGPIPVKPAEWQDRTRLPEVQVLRGKHLLDYPSLRERFVGRVDRFWDIYDALQASGWCLLTGTGGLGKTQLAIEYMHRLGYRYPGGAYWVDASQGWEIIVPQIAAVAQFTIDTTIEEAEQLKQLWRAFESRSRALVVFDNVPESVDPGSYQPPGSAVHLIATTRHSSNSGSTGLRLAFLSAEESLQLMNSGMRKFDGAEADPLLVRLAGLPLALELAKGFLNERRELTISQVIADMNALGDMDVLQEFANTYDGVLASGHDLDLVRTFELSWRCTSDEGRQILVAMAQLSPNPVPRDLLRSILGWETESPIRDQLARALTQLGRLSLVDFDAEENPQLHRLILAYVRHRHGADDALKDKCMQVLISYLDGVWEILDGNALQRMDAVAPHAEELLSVFGVESEKSDGPATHDRRTYGN